MTFIPKRTILTFVVALAIHVSQKHLVKGIKPVLMTKICVCTLFDEFIILQNKDVLTLKSTLYALFIATLLRSFC